jgi:hypothetical protein
VPVSEELRGIQPFFNDIAEHFHHGNRLCLCKPFFLQSLDKFEGIEVVVPRSTSCGMKSSVM